jgi:hypothetical protein
MGSARQSSSERRPLRSPPPVPFAFFKGGQFGASC